LECYRRSLADAARHDLLDTAVKRKSQVGHENLKQSK
jgi:hypothetical protein